MKKGGLGSIPKSLSWIDELEPETHVTEKKVITVKTKPTKEALFSIAAENSSDNENLKRAQKASSTGCIKATFIVDQELNNKIKALAYWKRLTVKEVVSEAFENYLQGKNVKPIPKKCD